MAGTLNMGKTRDNEQEMREGIVSVICKGAGGESGHHADQQRGVFAPGGDGHRPAPAPSFPSGVQTLAAGHYAPGA